MAEFGISVPEHVAGFNIATIKDTLVRKITKQPEPLPPHVQRFYKFNKTANIDIEEEISNPFVAEAIKVNAEHGPVTIAEMSQLSGLTTEDVEVLQSHTAITIFDAKKSIPPASVSPQTTFSAD